MKKIIYFLSIWMSIHFGYAQKMSAHISKEKDAVKGVLMQQQQAWNNGNIEGFMESYWHHDSLTFISKNGVNKGWQTTYNNYKRAYPDQATMGQLQFDILSMESLSATTVFVIGKWSLTREESKGNIGGFFTLVFKKIDKQWVIVSDHTS